MDREGGGELTPGPPPVPVHRVIARLNVGGPARHVVHLARDLPSRGFPTRLLAGSVGAHEGDMAPYAAEHGVPVERVPGLGREPGAVRDVRAFRHLLGRFREGRPAIVHTHTAKAGALGRLAAAAARVPVRVHTFHGHVLGGAYFSRPVTAAYRAVERALARLSDRLVVLSEAQLEEMSGELRIAPRERFRVVPLGLDLEPFAVAARTMTREEARARLDLPADRPVVGVVGRLVPVKNHGLLLEALARLPDEILLLVVGGGEREGELRALAEDLGVGHRVRWLGWRTDLPEIYPALDALALPSKDEGTPVAVIEALAAGVPVVAREVGGVGDVLGGGRHGALVPEEAAETLAGAIRDVLERPPSPERLDSARRAALRRFSSERLADDVAGLYREVLEEKGIR